MDAKRRIALGGLLGAGVVWALVHTSLEEELVGTWEQRRSSDGVTAHDVRTYLPNGVYVERTTYTGGSFGDAGKTSIESGTWRLEGERLHYTVIEGDSIESGSTYHADDPSIDGDQLVFPGKDGPRTWKRVRDLADDHDPEARTAGALDVARRELAAASACLLGGRLDDGPAWPRFHTRALAQSLALSVEGDAAGWPRRCVSSLEAAQRALEDLETKEALERCGPLRFTLRVHLMVSPDVGHMYGKVNDATPTIDRIAAGAARCGIADGAPPAPGEDDPGTEAAPPPPALVPFDGADDGVQLELAPSSPASVRLVAASEGARKSAGKHGLACSTVGGPKVDGLRCQRIEGPLDDVRLVRSLRDEVGPWLVLGSEGKRALASAERVVSLQADYGFRGDAFIDAEGTLRGIGDGKLLRAAPGGAAVETAGPPIAKEAKVRGDLVIAAKDGELVVDRLDAEGRATRLASLATPLAPGRTWGCRGGPGGFTFLTAVAPTRMIVGVARGDGGLDLVESAGTAVDDALGRIARATCGAGWTRLTWLGTDGRVKQLSCRREACELRMSEPLRARQGSHDVHVAAVADRVLVARHLWPDVETDLGHRVVYRVGVVEELDATRERLLVEAGPSGSGPADLEPRIAVDATSDVGVVVGTSKQGLFAYGVDREGAARPLPLRP